MVDHIMTDKVLIKLKGMHTITEADQDDVEVIVPGSCARMGDTWYVSFNEPVEETGTEIKSLLKMRRDSLEVTRTGAINTHMVFEKGKKTFAGYVTPLGEISLGISALDVRLQESDRGLDMKAYYDLDINYEPAARCSIDISVTDASTAQIRGRDEQN